MPVRDEILHEWTFSQIWVNETAVDFDLVDSFARPDLLEEYEFEVYDPE